MCTVRAYKDKLRSLHYKIPHAYIYCQPTRALILTILLLKNSNLFGFGYLLHLILVPSQMFEELPHIK
jgi:hypothetical protein